MNNWNGQMDDDELIAAVYDIGYEKPSFRSNFNKIMEEDTYYLRSIDSLTLLYSKSVSVPLLKKYVKGWSQDMKTMFRYGWSGREPHPDYPHHFQSALIKGPENVPTWILQNVVDEILEEVADVTEIWVCKTNNYNTAIVVVNKHGFYDIFANSNDELGDYYKCIFQRLEVIKKKYVHSSAIRRIINIIEQGQSAYYLDHTLLHPNPTDVAYAMFYFENPIDDTHTYKEEVQDLDKIESNGVISYSLKRSSLIRGAPLVLTHFFIRSNDDIAFDYRPLSKPILKRLYFAFAKRRWLTFLNATKYIREISAEPGSLTHAGANGSFYGIGGLTPFASYNDCMESEEYKSNRHLLRFVQEFNKAKGLPPPEVGNDDEWRSRICRDLTSKNLDKEERFVYPNTDSFSSGKIKKPITDSLKERLAKREKDRMLKQRIYNHLEKVKSVLVLCQRKESFDDTFVKESVIPRLESIIEDFLNITDNESVDIKYMVNLENPYNDKCDYNMILDKSDHNANEFIKSHKDFYDLIVLQTCPDTIMDLEFINYILKNKGYILITKVDYNGDISMLETSEYNSTIKKYTDFGFIYIHDDNFIVFQKK